MLHVIVDGKEYSLELAGEVGGDDKVRRSYLKDGETRTISASVEVGDKSPENLVRSVKPMLDVWEEMDMEQADLPF